MVRTAPSARAPSAPPRPPERADEGVRQRVRHRRAERPAGRRARALRAPEGHAAGASARAAGRRLGSPAVLVSYRKRPARDSSRSQRTTFSPTMTATSEARPVAARPCGQRDRFADVAPEPRRDRVRRPTAMISLAIRKYQPPGPRRACVYTRRGMHAGSSSRRHRTTPESPLTRGVSRWDGGERLVDAEGHVPGLAREDEEDGGSPRRRAEQADEEEDGGREEAQMGTASTSSAGRVGRRPRARRPRPSSPRRGRSPGVGAAPGIHRSEYAA